MSGTVEFTNIGLEMNDAGEFITDYKKRLLLSSLDAVTSTNTPVQCSCEHCGHNWSYVRFTPGNLDARIAYALDVANNHRKTDYHSYHAAAGRILDKTIDGIGGAEGSSPSNMRATVVALWDDGKVTDAFTLRPGLRAFNHVFGYMGKCCHDKIVEELIANGRDPEQLGINGPESLRLQFKGYSYGSGKNSVTNNERMMQWFEIAANAPTFPDKEISIPEPLMPNLPPPVYTPFHGDQPAPPAPGSDPFTPVG